MRPERNAGVVKQGQAQAKLTKVCLSMVVAHPGKPITKAESGERIPGALKYCWDLAH